MKQDIRPFYKKGLHSTVEVPFLVYLVYCGNTQSALRAPQTIDWEAVRIALLQGKDITITPLESLVSSTYDDQRT